VFYIFDEDKNGAISKSEVRRGISYLAIEGALVAPSQSAVDALFDSCLAKRIECGVDVPKSVAKQLRFADFFRLYLTLKTTIDSVLPKSK